MGCAVAAMAPHPPHGGAPNTVARRCTRPLLLIGADAAAPSRGRCVMLLLQRTPLVTLGLRSERGGD